jgi:hypothetical protein
LERFFNRWRMRAIATAHLQTLMKSARWLPHSGQHNTRGSWFMLALVIEGLVMLGHQSQAVQVYPLARELIGTGAVVLWPILRFTHTTAGLAAAAARQWRAAEDHFGIALQHAEAFPQRLEQAEIRRFQAMMLIDRAAPGDREKANAAQRSAGELHADRNAPPHRDRRGAPQLSIDQRADPLACGLERIRTPL